MEPNNEAYLANKRGKIAIFSKPSHRRAKKAIISIPGLKFFITITYGYPYPKNKIEIKSECRRLCSLLRRKGFFGIWKIEFQERDAPHFHLLINDPGQGKLFINQTMEIFRKNMKSEYQKGSISIKPFKYTEKGINYIAKQCKTPDPYCPGRYWSIFGPVPIKPIEPIEEDDIPEIKKENQQNAPNQPTETEELGADE